MAVLMNDVVMAILRVGAEAALAATCGMQQLPRGQPPHDQVRCARTDARCSSRNTWASAFERRASRTERSTAHWKWLDAQFVCTKRTDFRKAIGSNEAV